MILLQKITLKNFLSHQESEIEFKEDSKLLLSGNSGAGKTAICEGILFALFGYGRSDNKNLVRKGQKNASVSLKLVDEEVETIITRSVTDKGKNTLAITQKKEDKFLPIERVGLKDNDDWIQTIFLKSSYSLFVNSIVYVQNGENSFVKATAGERKNILLEIIHAANFDDLYVKAREAITKVESIISVNLSQKSGYEKTITDNEPVATTYSKLGDELTLVTEEINTKVKREKELESIVKESQTTAQKIKDKKQMIGQYDTILEGIDNRITYKEKTIKDNESVDIETAMTKVAELTMLQSDKEAIEKEIRQNNELQNRINAHLANKPTVYDYTKDIERINKQLIPLIKDSGSCPAGEDCPFVIPIKGQIEFLEGQIKDKEQKTLEEGTSMALWLNQYDLLPKPIDTKVAYETLERYKAEEAKLRPFQDVILRYEIGLKANEELRKEIEEDKKDRIKTVEEYNSLVNEVIELEKVKVDTTKEYAELHDIIEVIDTLEKKRETIIRDHTLAKRAGEVVLEARQSLISLDSEVKTLKTQYDDLLLIKEALGPRGVKAVAVDYVLPELEERINSILEQLSDFRIRLDTQQAKAKEEDGTKEGLWITVKNPEGEELPIENLSGGELVKISMSIAEGLASLVNSVGFRILDECINALDQESVQSFVEVVLKLQEKFPQVLCISHIQEVKDSFENKIMITKINGISKII